MSVYEPGLVLAADWLCPSVSSVYSRDQMERIITAHIQNVAGHYKGLCYAWDVVNEAMEDDGRYRQSPSRRALNLSPNCLIQAC